MATAYIREYRFLCGDDNGVHVQAGHEDGYTTGQTVSFTTSTASAVFQDTTRFIRITADAEAFLDFGSAPVAVAGDGVQIQADTPEFFGVVPGQKVAVYDGVS